MRILWVHRDRMVPVDSGGRIRTAQTIQHLSRRHDVKVVNFYSGRTRDVEYERLLENQFPGALAVRIKSPVAVRAGYLLRSALIGSLAPPAARSRNGAAHLKRLIASGEFDIALSDFVYAAVDFAETGSIPIVLHQHNVEWEASRTTARRERRPHFRLAAELRVWRLKRLEAAQIARFDHTFAVSDSDAARYREMAPGASVSCMGTGVDLSLHVATPLPVSERPLVVFTGHMAYRPNVDAVAWFCADIWPKVLAAVPAARLRIVGKSPTATVRALASNSVEVTGTVPSVVEHFVEASVVVVPIRTGGGTRLKIFEAMACGRPVVSTRFGAGGLPVEDGRDIVFADDPDEFASAVVRLLNDRVAAQALGKAASETASAHGWARVAGHIEEVLDGLVRSRRAPAGRRASDRP